jgi:probable phosphoglycerate mutase
MTLRRCSRSRSAKEVGTPTDVVIARHAETNYNAEGRISSDPADAACVLSPVGEQQAAALARELAPERFDLCVTSQLLRARQTAAPILRRQRTRLLELHDFNDVNAGVFDGGSSAAYVDWLATAGAMGSVAPPDGESLRDAVVRYMHGLDWLVSRPERKLLVVTHALPLALVLHARTATEPPPPDLLVGLFAQRAGSYGVTETVAHATPYRFAAADLRRARDYWAAT